MTELDKAVRQFREVRRQNATWIARIQRITRPHADDKLFDVAERRLKAQQAERKHQEVTQ
jgi:hypothetical protein